MSATPWIVPLSTMFLVSGCGTYVPEIQDFGDKAAGQQLVQSIVYNVTCEVQDAFNRIL